MFIRANGIADTAREINRKDSGQSATLQATPFMGPEASAASPASFSTAFKNSNKRGSSLRPPKILNENRRSYNGLLQAGRDKKLAQIIKANGTPSPFLTG